MIHQRPATNGAVPARLASYHTVQPHCTKAAADVSQGAHMTVRRVIVDHVDILVADHEASVRITAPSSGISTTTTSKPSTTDVIEAISFPSIVKAGK